MVHRHDEPLEVPAWLINTIIALILVFCLAMCIMYMPVTDADIDKCMTKTGWTESRCERELSR